MSAMPNSRAVSSGDVVQDADPIRTENLLLCLGLAMQRLSQSMLPGLQQAAARLGVNLWVPVTKLAIRLLDQWRKLPLSASHFSFAVSLVLICQGRAEGVQ